MIDVMIIAHNEAINLPFCLQALQGWVRKVFVIDSGSTDGTQDIARSLGAEVVSHAWEGYARQKNWGLKNLPFEAPWLLLLDADEVVTPPLRKILEEIASRPSDQTPENGFFINRLPFFLGRPIRHCGYYPSWNLRFFKRGQGYYEDREVHEHLIIDRPVGYIRPPMLHEDRRGLEHYVAKHNRYSTLEARATFRQLYAPQPVAHSANVPFRVRWRRWLKRYVAPRLPLPGLWRFLYMYVLQLGFLDGYAGLQFCRFISWYDSLVALKLHDLRRQLRRLGSVQAVLAQEEAGGLARPEGQETSPQQTGGTGRL